jgi:hypothetical protein
MKTLTRQRFERAQIYLRIQARSLEKAMFNMEFEGGSVEDVLTELQKFQNPDGGFGQALEPDLRTPTSSALCTEMGLRCLAEMQIPAGHPTIQAAVKYLLGSFDAKAQVWRVVPEDVNDYAHAPWWHEEDGSLARTFDDFEVIPRAGILASLYHYNELVPTDWLAKVTARTVDDIVGLDTEKFGGGGDTLVYALRLASAPGLAANFKSRLESRLREAANAVVTRDPPKWTEYNLPPLKISPAPDSLVADLISDDLQNHLDFLIEQQSPAGCWEPTWSWFRTYPESWEQAKVEWRGILTLDTLRSLKAFGRIS